MGVDVEGGMRLDWEKNSKNGEWGMANNKINSGEM